MYRFPWAGFVFCFAHASQLSDYILAFIFVCHVSISFKLTYGKERLEREREREGGMEGGRERGGREREGRERRRERGREGRRGGSERGGEFSE